MCYLLLQLREHCEDRVETDPSTRRALAAAAPVHRAAGFERAAPPGSHFGASGVLGALGELTRAVVAAGGADEDAGGAWLGDAAEMLLEAWVELLADHALGCRRCSTRDQGLRVEFIPKSKSNQ